MTIPLDTLWYTHSPVPTGLGIAVQTGRLAEAFQPLGTSIQSLRESSEREVRWLNELIAAESSRQEKGTFSPFDSDDLTSDTAGVESVGDELSHDDPGSTTDPGPSDDDFEEPSSTPSRDENGSELPSK